MTAITIKEGLDYILSHSEGQSHLFPRTISTKTTQGQQILVSSKEEALARFSQANWIDCRISAYTSDATENHSGVERFQGLRNITPKILVVIIDMDRSTFKSGKSLKLALAKTHKKIKDRLGNDTIPTVIWTGNGYHIYLVLDSEGIVLENVKEFIDLKVERVSVKFLRFVEWFLSDGKSDPQHNHSVSFNNCMLRIPGSYNSKCLLKGKDPEVKIIQKWNGCKPSIKLILDDFYVHLCEERINELQAHRIQNSSYMFSDRYKNNSILWIERLLQTPLTDFRKFCIWRILAPYLINVKKLSYEESFGIIRGWLNECDKLNRLDFYPSLKIRKGLRGVAKKGYFPISIDNLRIEYEELYHRIVSNQGRFRGREGIAMCNDNTLALCCTKNGN